MSVSIQIKGTSKVAALLTLKKGAVYNAANKAIIKSGFFVESEVKESIAGKRAETKSVDTGRFLNSVKTVQNVPLTSATETNVEYAKHLEYGTSRMKPRKHFNNTAKRSEKKVQVFVNNEIKKAL